MNELPTDLTPRLTLCPITIGAAKLLIAKWHRHHRPPVSGLFAAACALQGSDEFCGCAIVGRPVARALQDGWTAEVTRLATDGTPMEPQRNHLRDPNARPGGTVAVRPI